MKAADAAKIARDFLCESIAIERCEEVPEGLYDLNRSEELLFTFRLFGHTSVGASEYIAVSKETGAARYLGFYGE